MSNHLVKENDSKKLKIDDDDSFLASSIVLQTQVSSTLSQTENKLSRQKKMFDSLSKLITEHQHNNELCDAINANIQYLLKRRTFVEKKKEEIRFFYI